jgi:ribose-phosphate pyrophosphokinase
MESILFSISGRDDFANQILRVANYYSEYPSKAILGECNVQKFSDGELCVDFNTSVRGKIVYILSDFNNSDEVIKLMLAIDAAKRAEAAKIIPVLPYFIYARGDKKDQARGPIAAKIMAEMIEQRGATSVIITELHADQIQGFFNIPVTHIQGKNIFDTYISRIADENTILCAPDAGSGKRVERMIKQLKKYHGIDLTYVLMHKIRSGPNEIEKMIIIGDVKDKNVIILDDLVDTGGTLCRAAEELKNNGAKTVRAVITHGVLSGKAYENIANSVFEDLCVSDSLPPHTRESYPRQDMKGLDDFSRAMCKINVISVTEQIGYAIAAMNGSLSYDFLKKQHLLQK